MALTRREISARYRLQNGDKLRAAARTYHEENRQARNERKRLLYAAKDNQVERCLCGVCGKELTSSYLVHHMRRRHNEANTETAETTW